MINLDYKKPPLFNIDVSVLKKDLTDEIKVVKKDLADTGIRINTNMTKMETVVDNYHNSFIEIFKLPGKG